MQHVPDNTQSDDSCHELAALQGRSKQIGLEVGGICDPPDSVGAPGALTTIVENHFEVHGVTGTVLLEGTFTLDASTTPKAITWIDSIGSDKGKRLPASYLLEGEQFKFIAADEGAPRPTVFCSCRGQTMRTFVRSNL